MGMVPFVFKVVAAICLSLSLIAVQNGPIDVKHEIALSGNKPTRIGFLVTYLKNSGHYIISIVVRNFGKRCLVFFMDTGRNKGYVRRLIGMREGIILLIIVGLWYLLQAYILPKLGVST